MRSQRREDIWNQFSPSLSVSQTAWTSKDSLGIFAHFSNLQIAVWRSFRRSSGPGNAAQWVANGIIRQIQIFPSQPFQTSGCRLEPTLFWILLSSGSFGTAPCGRWSPYPSPQLWQLSFQRERTHFLYSMLNYFVFKWEIEPHWKIIISVKTVIISTTLSQLLLASVV